MLIILLYCIPYPFLSMYIDYSNGSMVGYIIMIAVTSIIAFCATRIKYIPALMIGNVALAIISYYFSGQITSEKWGWYFKPFTASQLSIIVSLVNLLPQLTAMGLAKIYKARG